MRVSLPSPQHPQHPQQQANDAASSSSSASAPLQNRSKKDPWTTEEDELLLRLVGEMGNRWRDIAITINSQYGHNKRIGKQCRERYLNHLKQGVKNSPWTPEEDELLRQNQKIYGNKWAAIAAAMPGRPENQVKNRWNAANFNKHGSGGAEEEEGSSTPTPTSNSLARRLDKRPRMSFLDLQHQQQQQPPPHPQQPPPHPQQPPPQHQYVMMTPMYAVGMAPPPQTYWQGGQQYVTPPAMLFPHYFAQQQLHQHQQQQQQLAMFVPPPPPQFAAAPRTHFVPPPPSSSQPGLFTPLVRALELGDPVAIAAASAAPPPPPPPKTSVAAPFSFAPAAVRSPAEMTPPFTATAAPLHLGASPPSSCQDLFAALKADTDKHLQQQRQPRIE